MSNSFGQLYKFTTFGESHGPGIGVVIDGCPAGLELNVDEINAELAKRRPGQSKITTQRKEPDDFVFLSGVIRDGLTTGAPLTCWIANKNQKSVDYDHLEQTFRPSHADYTSFAKYGVRDHRGGGRSSARETAARVIAGTIAKQILRQKFDIQFFTWVKSIGELAFTKLPDSFELTTSASKMVRCPDPELAVKMVEQIDLARKEGDSLGGVVSACIKGVPAGWGEPVYQKLHAILGSAMLGINAVKGFEIGSGFAGTRLRGSQHNDAFFIQEDKIRTKTNNSGGVQGGITNGEEILFNVAFKPTSTIMREQSSVNAEGEEVKLAGKGRHDPCVVPRAVPVVEAMAAAVLVDFYFLSRSNRV